MFLACGLSIVGVGGVGVSNCGLWVGNSWDWGGFDYLGGGGKVNVGFVLKLGVVVGIVWLAVLGLVF